MTQRTLAGLEALPAEMIDAVVSHVSRSELSEMCGVCKPWYGMAATRLYASPCITSVEQLDLLTNTSKDVQCLVARLDLSGVREKVTDDHLAKLVGCRRLRVLNLGNCSNVSPSTMNDVLDAALDTLVEVTLANCRLSTEVLTTLGRAASRALQRLDLSNTMIRPCMTIDAPHHLETMTQWAGTSRLVELNLSYCRWVDGNTLKNLGRLMGLQRLNLQWCHQLGYPPIQTMIATLHELTSVDLRHITAIDSPDAAQPLFSSGPRLAHILFTHRLESACLLRARLK